MTMAQLAERLRTLRMPGPHCAASISAPPFSIPPVSKARTISRFGFSLQSAGQNKSDPGGNGLSDPNGAVSLSEALNRQLGLKLSLEKRPASVLVIDHVERKPVEN